MIKKPAFRYSYRIIFGLIAWFALAGHFNQIVLQRSADTSFLHSIVSYFSYFTIQSNWLVALWWGAAVMIRGPADHAAILKPKVKGAFTVYISVTMIAYAVLLANSWMPHGFDLALSTITHYITPLAFILDWVFCTFHFSFYLPFQLLNFL